MKIGVVNAVDETTGKCRVQFGDLGGLQSYWLPVMQPKTGADKCYHLPDMGEHVVCLMDERFEHGVIAGAIYSGADTPPVASSDKWHMAFADGSSIEYDRATHTMTANIQGPAIITATGGVTLHGNLVVNGTISSSGSIETGGSVNAAGNIIDGGGNTNHHSH